MMAPRHHPPELDAGDQTQWRRIAGVPRDDATGDGFERGLELWQAAMQHNWWSEREELGWPELVGIELEASAGARCVRQLRLEQAGEQNEQRRSNYVRVRVCWVGHCD